MEADAVEAIAAIGAPLVICANEPPWSTVRPALEATELLTEIDAWNMDLAHLTARAWEP